MLPEVGSCPSCRGQGPIEIEVPLLLRDHSPSYDLLEKMGVGYRRDPQRSSLRGRTHTSVRSSHRARYHTLTEAPLEVERTEAMPSSSGQHEEVSSQLSQDTTTSEDQDPPYNPPPQPVKRFAGGFTLLMSAAYRGNVRRVRKHAARKIGLQDNDGRTALMWAAYAGDRKCIELLIGEAGMQ